MSFKLGNRPALDGLRGISVLMVILIHLDLPWWAFRGGFLGVQFFFVLSGFLITTLLLEEWQETSDLRIGNFYARRAIRLLPAFLVMLLFCVGLSAAVDPWTETRATLISAAQALCYSSNWFIVARNFPGFGYLGHTWSLSIEEQFYLIWPPLLLVLLRFRKKSVLIGALVGLIALCTTRRVWLWLDGYDKFTLYFSTETNADAILVGALLAALVFFGYVPTTDRGRSWLYLVGTIATLLIPVGLFKLVYYQPPICNVLHLGGILGIHVLTAGLILALLFTPLRTLYEFRPLVWLGRLSYSLYLWHFPVMTLVRMNTPRSVGNWSLLLGVLASFAAAALSYYAIEMPLHRFRRRFRSTAPETSAERAPQAAAGPGF